MPLIPEGVIDEIQARADIAELIGRYVPLKRAGRHFKANCPFHKERSPSFMVNTEKQIFHCFGCGVGGNVFTFLMRHDRLTFPEAVRQLAGHVGIPVPDEGPSTDDGARAAITALMEKVSRHFERRLLDTNDGKAAREYLRGRGVSDGARQAFRVGLAPDGWDRLLRAAKATGCSAKELEGAGLVVKGTSGYYDRFRHRLIFPITDVRGRVIGFGGRSLDGKEPKYLNSPETLVYSKGRHLFGLSQAKDAILKAKTVVVVEGYFDCVVLASAGVANVVSPLGTALTADQARLLKRYAEQVVLAFDPDAAGEQATLRGIDLVVELGLQVQVAELPPGVDPDEFVTVHGRQRLQELLDRGVGLFEFLVQSALRRYPTRTMEDKVRAAQFVLPTIAKVPDAMLRSEYVRQLAERLHLDEAAVAEELAKAQPRSPTSVRVATTGPRGGRTATASAGARTEGPERLLVALALDEPFRAAQVQRVLSLGQVVAPELRRIVEVICELEAAGHPATPAHVVSRLPEDQAGEVTALVELAQSVASKDEAFQECVKRLHARAKQQRLAVLREQMQSAQQAGADEEVHRLLAEYQQQLSTAPVTEPVEASDMVARRG